MVVEHKSRCAALAIVACTAAAIAASVFWAGAGAVRPVRLIAAEAIAVAIACPIALRLARRYDSLKRKAAEDGLTGALTRGFIEEAFPLLAAKAQEKGKRMSVTIIDINDFKIINDTCGHRGGDLVLREIAEALRAGAERGELLARWGGDEFVYICPYAGDRLAAAAHKRIDACLEKLSLKLGLRVTASAGSAVFPEDGRVLDDLVHIADGRMYCDKKGRKTGEPPEALQA